MDRKGIFIFGMALLIGLMFTGCAWYHNDHASPYHNVGPGLGYYGYPYYQGYEEGENNPVFDEHHHHRH